MQHVYVWRLMFGTYYQTTVAVITPRFGVRQKEQVLGLCDTTHPHVLSMTATPIPRTLALVK